MLLFNCCCSPHVIVDFLHVLVVVVVDVVVVVVVHVMFSLLPMFFEFIKKNACSIRFSEKHRGRFTVLNLFLWGCCCCCCCCCY